VLQFVPVRDPHSKPFVESFFAGLKKLLEHRTIITTKSSPEQRGEHDPVKEAAQRGITPDEIERTFIRYVVDVHRIRRHRGLRAAVGPFWDVQTRRFGSRTWQRSADDLRRLLRRDEGERLITEKGISYGGRWYSADFVTQTDGTVRIKVDEDDMRGVDVYATNGVFLGRAWNGDLKNLGRPISRWELRLADDVAAVSGKHADERALRNKHRIEAELERDEKDRARQVANMRHRQKRAEEAMTDFERGLAVVAAAERPAPPPSPVWAAPTPDADDYDSLLDSDSEEFDHVA